MRGYTIGMTACLLLFAACASTPEGQKQSDKVSSAVKTFGDAATAAESNLRITWEAYNTLLSTDGDLKKPYDEFVSGLGKCQKDLTAMETTFQQARAAAATYFQTYEENLESIHCRSVSDEAV